MFLARVPCIRAHSFPAPPASCLLPGGAGRPAHSAPGRAVLELWAGRPQRPQVGPRMGRKFWVESEPRLGPLDGSSEALGNSVPEEEAK